MAKKKQPKKQSAPPAKGQIRNRIKELRIVPAAQLTANPANWRTHGEGQRAALSALLRDVGYADALIARETESGELILIDGHLRAEVTPDQEVPVLIVDVDEAEAAKLLALLDPLAEKAGTDEDKLDELLAQIDSEEDALLDLIADLSASAAAERDEPAKLRTVKVDQPPRMAWILIGVPVVKYWSLAHAIEKIANHEDTIVEMTVNNQGAEHIDEEDG